MASLHATFLAAIASHLFLESAPRQIAHPHRSLTEFCHDFRQTSVGAGRAIALGDLKKIQ